MKMTSKKVRAEFERTNGTVFVSVRNPNRVAPATPIEQQYSDAASWAEIGEQMISEIPVESEKSAGASHTVTVSDDSCTDHYHRDGAPLSEPEAQYPSIAPADEIRVYRTDPDRKRHQIYTGEYTDDIDKRCQTYADLSGCNVELHNACEYKVFESANPKPPAVRIPVGAKSNTVAVYNDDSSETVWVGDRTPGFDCRCQRYAEKHCVTLRVVFDGGTCVQYFVPRSVEGRYLRENAERKGVQ